MPGGNMQTLPPPVDQLVGNMLGNYEVKQLLGHGNVNAVYAAQQQSQSQAVMLTVFTVPETFSPQSRERFLTRFTQIASTLVRLDHPYILPTYDFGAQFGYPYLVTPFVNGGSLARVLRQETRCTPEHALRMLKQIAEGLEYANQNGMAHGTLKPATILLDDAQNVRITGFGLANILKMRGIETSDSQYAHLVNVAGSFLGAPEYIAPEVVQGAPADARSDIYALGIMLFELLTGKLPFSGNDPFVVAVQHVQQSVPSLQSLSPDALPGLDLVIQRAVDPDPAQRFPSAIRLASAFERVLTVIQGASSPHETVKETTSPLAADLTMPPTVNWDEESSTGEYVPAKPSLSTSQMPTLTNPRMQAGNWQLRPPIVTNQLAAIKANQIKPAARSDPYQSGRKQDQMERAQAGYEEQISSGRRGQAEYGEQTASGRQGQMDYGEQTSSGYRGQAEYGEQISSGRQGQTEYEEQTESVKKKRQSKKTFGSFSLWTNNSAWESEAAPNTNMQAPGTFEKTAKRAPKKETAKPSATATPKGRRRVVAMLATGTVAAGIIGATGLGISHFLQKDSTQTASANHPATAMQTTQNKSTTTKQANNGKQTTVKKPATTTKPTVKKAQQPALNGVVVGKSNQAANSAQPFNNPADKNDSLLIRLPNGTFVAYERACTHQQVPVNYHEDTKTLVCPLHGSVFDPAQNGKVLQGPATTPLPPVKVSVNGDGTVTVV
jgi:serine/threonine protein kinase/Rieske Fe-S protein